ncbi:hypothetical protein LSAT2_004190, partial [Lamellibrachia satsuma]
LPSSVGRSSSSCDTTSSEDADVIDDGDIEAGRPKRTSVRVTMARRLKPEASSSVTVRRRRSLSRTNPRTGTLNRTTNFHPGYRHLPATRHRRPTLHHLRMQTISRSKTGTSKRAALREHQLDTSEEDTDDDGDIKIDRLKTPSCKATIAIRLKRACHFRCRSEGCRFCKLLDEVVSQTLSNA